VEKVLPIDTLAPPLPTWILVTNPYSRHPTGVRIPPAPPLHHSSPAAYSPDPTEDANPPGSTKKATTPNTKSAHLLSGSNSSTQLAIPLQRLIEGFLLSCKVENKSPATISFYKNILDKFQWYLEKFGIDTIDATAIRSFLGYLKESPNRWDSNNTRANRPVCAYTVDRYYTGLSALFRWALSEGMIGTNPMATIRKPRFQRKIIKGLEPDICNRLLSSFGGRNLDNYINYFTVSFFKALSYDDIAFKT
jgi:hypothetical protein